jgi:sugar-specific transcriptional regulator TrmB
MDNKLLQDIGLTEGESKVYITLIQLGQSKTGPLAKESGVSASKVYKVLDRLIKKGLVGHILIGKIKHFKALEPKRLLDYLEEKEKETKLKKEEIKKIIPELETAQKLALNQNNAVIYEGFKSVTNFFRSLLDELKAGEEYYVIGAGYGGTENNVEQRTEIKGLHSFFHMHHQRRSEKKIKLKMLANHNTRENLEPTTYNLAEIRFLPEYLLSNMEIVFYKNKTFIIIWSQNPTGFLLENSEATQGFKNYFDTFWKIGTEK